MSVLQPDNRGMEHREWPRTVPEDVFHTGQLSYKVKGSYKYQSMWGVLRFESAMGPKRLELFEPDTREKCFLINANIYPTTSIPFTQLLGLHPEHTIRPGIFPIQVMTTCKKYHLATKTKEEQQKWLTKFNTLLYGSPRPNRTYEYMVMVFPTKLSNEMNLRGSYIFSVTENSVHLISRDTSDHMTYKIPLDAIVRTSHTVFSNSSVQFAPYSDRKSNIKVLALTIETDCDLKMGGYVFAATSAAEIVTVINERRAKSCKCSLRPTHIPIRHSPSPENGIVTSGTDNQLTVPCRMPSPQSSLSTGVQSSSLTLTPTFVPTSQILPTPRNSTMPSMKSRTLGGESHATTFADAISPVHESPNSKEKAKAMKSIKSTKKKSSEEHKKPSSPPGRLSPKPPKRKFHTSTPLTYTGTNSLTSLINITPSANGLGQGFKPAAIRNLQNSLQRVSSEPVMASDIVRDNKSRFDPHAYHVEVVIADDDNSSTTSSSSSHDYDDIVNKTSPTESPPDPSPLSSPQTSPYVNLSCLICSKKHQWDDSGSHCRAFQRNHQEEILVAVTSSRLLKRRSRSMQNFLEDVETSVPRNTSSLTQAYHQPTTLSLNERHSTISHDFSKPNAHQSQSHSTDILNSTQTFRKRSAPSQTTQKTISIKNSRSYESIRSNGPYEQVPQGRLPSIMVATESDRTSRQQHSSPPTFYRPSARNGMNTRAQVTTEERYKTIKNSGPYETAHRAHDVHSDQIQPSPAPNMHNTKNVVKPIPRKRKKKLQQLASVTNNSILPGNYESIQNNSESILCALSKRSGSMGDLLDIRDTSEMYQTHPTDIQDNEGLHISKSAQATPCGKHSPINFSELSQNYEHHEQYVMNLESPEDKPNTSPQALPYAMVWLDRL